MTNATGARTLACTTCGHPVAPGARRCPNCNAKRPAPTMANAAAALIGLVVAVVVVLVLVFSHGFSGGSSAVDKVKAQDGDCLTAVGVSFVDATTVDQSDGSTDVILSDGATFNVSGSSVTPKGDPATADILRGCP